MLGIGLNELPVVFLCGNQILEDIVIEEGQQKEGAGSRLVVGVLFVVPLKNLQCAGKVAQVVGIQLTGTEEEFGTFGSFGIIVGKSDVGAAQFT